MPRATLAQSRGEIRVAHNAIEKPTRLLGVDAIEVEFAGVFKGFLNRRLRDLVEDDALEPLGGTADYFAQMPGDRLPFPVEVCREVDRVCVARELGQLGNNLLFAGQDFVVRLPPLLGIDAHAGDQRRAGLLLFMCGALGRGQLAGNRRGLGAGGRVDAVLARATHGKITHVSYARLHNEVFFAQVFVDRPGFGRRFDDNE